jgi:hypothetical protein
MTYHRICKTSNTTGATSGTGTVYLCSFSGVRVAQSLVFYVVFCGPSFAFYPLSFFFFFFFGHSIVYPSIYGFLLPISNNKDTRVPRLLLFWVTNIIRHALSIVFHYIVRLSFHSRMKPKSRTKKVTCCKSLNIWYHISLYRL